MLSLQLYICLHLIGHPNSNPNDIISRNIYVLQIFRFIHTLRPKIVSLFVSAASERPCVTALCLWNEQYTVLCLNNAQRRTVFGITGT